MRVQPDTTVEPKPTLILKHTWHCPDCEKVFDVPGGQACKSRLRLIHVMVREDAE